MTQRVLIVDDEPIVRMTLRYAIDENRFAISEVDSAEAALGLPAEQAFDLFVLDKNLPGMSGVDLAKQLRLRDAAPSILLVTGYATVDSAVEAMNAGADGFLEKPFDDIAKITVRINDMLGLAAKRRAIPRVDKPRSTRFLIAGGPDCDMLVQAARAMTGISVVSVATQDALANTASQADVVLVDDTLSDVESLAQLVPRVQAVVAIHARPTVEDVDRYMRLGITGLLAKPLARAQIDELLARLVK